ncbi:MAG: hypothetical protein WC700_16855 [Gemmatimonadaceae bacterium]|jgi:hypothetical protein
MTNLLRNGDFSRGLYEWTGTGTLTRALGYPRLNAARLAAGQSLSQAQGISEQNLHTLHYFYQVATGATLTVGYGAVTQTHTGAPLDVWREGVLAFAPDVGGGNESVELSAAGGVAYVDTVTLLTGGLPVSRAATAATVADLIAAFATDAGLVMTANADGPEGDYSAAIDEALRALGAVTPWGDPDVTLLAATQVNDLLEGVKQAMLQRLRATYALDVDVTLGPRSERRSQIAGSIDEMLAGAGSDRRVKMGKLTHSAWLK